MGANERNRSSSAPKSSEIPQNRQVCAARFLVRGRDGRKSRLGAPVCERRRSFSRTGALARALPCAAPACSAPWHADCVDHSPRSHEGHGEEMREWGWRLDSQIVRVARWMCSHGMTRARRECEFPIRRCLLSALGDSVVNRARSTPRPSRRGEPVPRCVDASMPDASMPSPVAQCQAPRASGSPLAR